MKFSHAVTMVSVATVVVVASSLPTLAQKEQFERTKIHVNVGTLNESDDPSDLKASTGGGSDSDRCAVGEVWLAAEGKCGPAPTASKDGNAN